MNDGVKTVFYLFGISNSHLLMVINALVISRFAWSTMLDLIGGMALNSTMLILNWKVRCKLEVFFERILL